jgi:hypothetical protein
MKTGFGVVILLPRGSLGEGGGGVGERQGEAVEEKVGREER